MASKGAFFTEEETRTTHKLLHGCDACLLHKKCTTPRMPAEGSGKRKILFITEAPSRRDDKAGHLLSGPGGKRLRFNLKRDSQIDLDECRLISALACTPGSSRDPAPVELEACNSRIWDEIKTHPPRVIVLLGSGAINAFVWGRRPSRAGGINDWRTWEIPDRRANAWAIATYDPTHVQSAQKDQPVLEQLFRQDLRKLRELEEKSLLMYTDEAEEVEVVQNQNTINQELRQFIRKRHPVLSFDYETTGLKPHNSGHKIVSLSMSSGDRTVSFPVDHSKADRLTDENRRLVCRVLTHPKIKKMAHNLPFEDAWSSQIFKIQITPWGWDSQLAAHILYNKKGVCSLKFQSYVNLGLEPYDTSIKQWLTGEGDNANSFNRVEDAPLDDLLLYGGIDAIAQYRLAVLQMEKLGQFLWD